MNKLLLKNSRNIKDAGNIMISIIVFAAITVTVIVGMVNWGASMLSGLRTAEIKEQALQIAEAGIDYYRWHLAQYPTDYKDGTTTPGPYYHNFEDKSGNVIGSYSLVITPPTIGSTKVVITSTATTTANPNIVKIVEATLAQPSLAQYATIANDNLRFGIGTNVYGPISSNKGIHFDGVAYNLVSSSLATDTDPDDSGCWPQPSCRVKWGVFTENGTDDPRPPTPANNRPDIFRAGRQYPTPAYPFASLTVNLTSLLTLAAPGGVCNSPSCWVASNKQGYYMHLNTNNTFDMYKVNTQVSAPNHCDDPGQVQWNTWSVGTLSSKIGTYTIPANGVIFVKDHLWIDGQVNGTRVTIVAADIGQTDPTKYFNININNDLRYTNYDGTDVIGLISQYNINVGLVSENDLTIDAALIAEIGRVGRHYYGNCSISGTNYSNRSVLTLNGMIATAIRYGFAYVGSSGACSNVHNGYCTRNLNYDGNLLYSPPPSFPLASTQYQMISWKQLK